MQNKSDIVSKNESIIIRSTEDHIKNNIASLIKNSSVNNYTDQLTDVLLKSNLADSIANLNIQDSSNILIGNAINVTGSIKINQYIINQQSESSGDRLDLTNSNIKKISTRIIENDEEFSDDEETSLNSIYDNIVPDFRVITRSEWKARPSGPIKKFESLPEYVIIAHTVSEACPTRLSNMCEMRYIQNMHIDLRRWPDIGYNFIVGGDGAVYEGRGWDTIGNHSRNFNSRSICIALIGQFCEVLPPQKQIIATKNIIELCNRAGKLDKNYKLIGHRQVIPTLSPGEFLYSEIQSWPHYYDVNLLE